MIETMRQDPVFSAAQFGNRLVDVIGIGSTGSKAAMELVRHGIRNFRMFDDDIVEDHNRANQIFRHADISKPKVTAALELAKEIDPDAAPLAVQEKVDGSAQLGDVVFLLTDTMSSRKDIWHNAIKFHPGIQLMIETRMDADSYRIYVINPCNPAHIEAYEQTLYDDDVAEVSACGASVTVGATATMLAGHAVFQLIRWFAIECGFDDDELENEIIIGLRGDTQIITRRFS